MKSLAEMLSKIEKSPLIVLGVILMFGLLLRLLFFSGVGISDDLGYSTNANHLNKGWDGEREGEGVITLSTRVGIVYITSISYKLLGVSDLSSVLFVLLSSIGMIALAFFFGRLLFSAKVGLIASFIVAIFPLEIVYATKLLSDVPSAFFMSLGVYMFLFAEKKGRKWFTYFFSGCCIGLGYLIRESAILIALFFVAYLLWKKSWKMEFFAVGAGVGVFFVVECIALFALMGDPLYKYTTVQEFIKESSIMYNYYGRLDFPEGIFHYPYLMLTEHTLLYLYLFIFVSLWYHLQTRKEGALALLCWFIPLTLYLSFGSSSFSSYTPFVGKDRYLTIVTIPGALLVASMLSQKEHVIRKVLLPSVLAILLVGSLGTTLIRDDRKELEFLSQAVEYLDSNGYSAYADYRSALASDYITKFSGENPIAEYPQMLRNGEYVVVNSGVLLRYREANTYIDVPQEILHPPKEWKLIREFGSGERKVSIFEVR